MAQLHFVTQQEVKHLIDLSANDGIIPNENVQYVALFSSNEIVSIGGFIIKGKTALFKGDYTPETHRCKGYHKTLLIGRMNIVRDNYKVKKIIANCTPMSLKLYLSIGFKIVKQYKNGITSVVAIFN